MATLHNALPESYLRAFVAHLDGRWLTSGLNYKEMVTFEPGLADAECAAIEGRFGFRFPPDLRSLLQYALPVSGGVDPRGKPGMGSGFINWRDWPEPWLQERMNVSDGICFDIENNVFWPADWGPKPDRIEDAFVIARTAIELAPRLIPVYSHRYIPEQPQAAGNPVFSIHQSDILRYGEDLMHYFKREFGLPAPRLPEETFTPIDFWDEISG